VEFVEQQRADAGGPAPAKFGIVLQHPRQDAFGDDLDAGLRRNPVLEADAVADRSTHAFADLFRHETGGRARGHAPWFQHHDLAAAEPAGIEQRERHLRGLARPGRRFQYQARMRGERFEDARQQLGDREMLD